MQSNDVRDLHQRGVHIWDEWMVDPDGIYRIYEPITEEYEKEKEVVVLDPFRCFSRKSKWRVKAEI